MRRSRAVEGESLVVQMFDFFNPGRHEHVDRSSLFNLAKKRFRGRVHDADPARYPNSNSGTISMQDRMDVLDVHQTGKNPERT